MWVARDKGYLNCDNDIIQDCAHLFWNKPQRADWLWAGKIAGQIDIRNLFPNLTWEDEPIEVRLTTDENNQAIYDLGYKNAAERALEFVKEHWDEYILATNEGVMGRPILEIDKDLDFEKDFHKELGI